MHGTITRSRILLYFLSSPNYLWESFASLPRIAPNQSTAVLVSRARMLLYHASGKELHRFIFFQRRTRSRAFDLFWGHTCSTSIWKKYWQSAYIVIFTFQDKVFLGQQWRSIGALLPETMSLNAPFPLLQL